MARRQNAEITAASNFISSIQLKRGGAILMLERY
jgi:hypothetical protein